MKVVFAERARRDIAEIFDAIAAHRPAAAQRVEDVIRLNCERLGDFPSTAVKTDEPDLWRLPVVRYPYKIYYRLRG